MRSAVITATASGAEAAPHATFTTAPGSIVIARDESWLVTAGRAGGRRLLVHVAGLSELVQDTEAVFSTAVENIVEHDPAQVDVVGDDSERFRRSRLWIEAMLRKSPVAISDPGLTTDRSA